MEETLETFETFLRNKLQFVKDMLQIVNNPLIRADYETQYMLLEDIIHHYEVIVKGKMKE